MLVLMRVKKNKLAMVGFGILIIMILFCVIGPIFSPYEQETMSFAMKKQPPSFAHWFGTDVIGRDILTRLMYGGRVSLLVGFVAVIIEVAIGGILGGIAGFYGGIVDSIIMRIVDIFLCIPFLPLLIILGAILSNLDVSS